jgi:valyl-tRNA synthetase
MTSLTPPGQNVLLSIDKFQIGKHFANKIWNAAKFVLSSAESAGVKVERPSQHKALLNTADRWILTLLEELKSGVTDQFEKYRFNDACQALNEFFWHRFCDWFLEISKVDLNSGDPAKKAKTVSVLVHVLKESMKLLHPVMPFITEEIWRNLPAGPDRGESLMTGPWPARDDSLVFPEDKKTFEFVCSVVYCVRNIRGEMGIEPSKKISIVIKSADPEKVALAEKYGDYIRFLAGTADISLGTDIDKPEPSSSAVVDCATEVFVPLKGNVDLSREKQRLEKEIAKLQKNKERNETKLANPAFVGRAPKEVVEAVKAETAGLIEKIGLHERNLKKL